jgi:hypothetical protein
MKQAPIFLLFYLITLFNHGCTSRGESKPILRAQLRKIVSDYIKKSDSLSFGRKVIMLELDSTQNDTTFYRLKTIISRNVWNKPPTDTLLIDGSFILMCNTGVDSANQKAANMLMEEYLPFEMTKTYNAVVWRILSTRDTMIVNRAYNEVTVAAPTIKFAPPPANKTAN